MLFVDNHIINIVISAHTWLFRITAAVILTAAAAELNPRPLIGRKVVELHGRRDKRDGRYTSVVRKE
jgi:hypothetical protein